jgi:hypothetical protein
MESVSAKSVSSGGHYIIVSIIPLRQNLFVEVDILQQDRTGFDCDSHISVSLIKAVEHKYHAYNLTDECNEEDSHSQAHKKH